MNQQELDDHIQNMGNEVDYTSPLTWLGYLFQILALPFTIWFWW